MDTYDVRIEPYRPKLKHKSIGALVLVLLYGAIFFFVRIGLSVLFPAPKGQHRGSVDRLVADGALAFVIWIFGWLVTYSILNKPDRSKRRDFKIVVEADSIAAVYPKSRRVVHKGEIRSIFVIKASSLLPGGIGISEKSEFAARMLGFVFVPNDLPEFDMLKRLAESWRVSPHE